jgi:hypothetical protein
MFCNLDTQRFGGTLDLFDTHLHRRQFAQQCAAFGKAHQSRRAAGHSQYSGGERELVQVQTTITWTEPTLACGAMVVGALQLQGAENAFKRLGMPPTILSRVSTTNAGQYWPGMIGCICVHSLFQRSRGQPQCLTPQGRLQRLEVQIVHSPATYERFDFRDDIVLDLRLKPFF